MPHFETGKFIECVQRYPCLYDIRDRHFRDGGHKQKVWEKICEELQIDDNYAKKRWKNLRDNFKRTMTAEADDPLRTKLGSWPWRENMEFLRPHFRDNRLKGTRGANDDISDLIYSLEDGGDSGSNDDDAPLIKRSKAERESFAIDEIPITFVKHEIPLAGAAAASPTTQDLVSVSDLERVVALLQSRGGRNDECDAEDNLFKSYAQTFKRFSKQNQIWLKVEIAKLFAQAETKEMREHNESMKDD